MADKFRRLFSVGHYKWQIFHFRLFGYGLAIKDSKHQTVSYPEHVAGWWIGSAGSSCRSTSGSTGGGDERLAKSP
jgi:hypothetical protein